jgi:hypothetical protein
LESGGVPFDGSGRASGGSESGGVPFDGPERVSGGSESAGGGFVDRGLNTLKLNFTFWSIMERNMAVVAAVI